MQKNYALESALVILFVIFIKLIEFNHGLSIFYKLLLLIMLRSTINKSGPATQLNASKSIQKTTKYKNKRIHCWQLQ